MNYNERNKIKQAERLAAREAVRAQYRGERPAAIQAAKEEPTLDNLFKAPLFADSYGSYIFDSTNQMLLQSIEDCGLGMDLQIAFSHMLASAYNGHEGLHPEIKLTRYNELKTRILERFEFPMKWSHGGECLTDAAGHEFFLVRAWGYLTGNPCRLSNEEAIKVQDSMLEKFCNEFNKRYGGKNV